VEVGPDAVAAPDALEPSPPGQLLQSPDLLPDLLDGGVPALDAGAPVDDASLALPDAGPPASPDAGPPDAGPPDAGPTALTEPDAGALPPSPADTADGDLITALREWMWERAERASAEREPAPSAERGEEPRADAPWGDLQQAVAQTVREWLGFAEPDRRMSAAALVVLLLLTMLGLWAVDRARRTLPERGAVPRLVGAARFALRLVAVVIVLVLASRLLPEWMRPALLVVIAGAAVALGFGAMWVLLPDVIGGIALLTEGRLKPGQWIAGDGFAGVVQQVGPRVTLLRGADGAIVTVPNRAIVRSAVRASDRRWHEIEVELRAPHGASAAALREAIRDAVLSSPYVPLDPGLVLARDPREPELWRLKVRLLDVRFRALFEGQLAERVDEALARGRSPSDGAPPGST
ncbi:MAG TPA: mechanosensitive ion channel domain-containing protein, partial [Myxococcota bacterium]